MREPEHDWREKSSVYVNSGELVRAKSNKSINKMFVFKNIGRLAIKILDYL